VELGIIGVGRFGRLAAKLLKNDFQVRVYDSRKSRCPQGVSWRPLSEVAAKPVVVLCVPISEIKKTCLTIRPFLGPGQLILDTCSVKVRPLTEMLRTLPEFVEILGTHPLFGPDSVRQGIRGLKIVLCPTRCQRLLEVKRYLREKGLDVIVSTPDQHDREMAKTQSLFHFLARGIAKSGIQIGRLSTPGPAQFFRDLAEVQNDSPQLFQDLQTMNRYAAPARRRLIRSLVGLDKALRRK
jgi:prephenate dehydrogenase